MTDDDWTLFRPEVRQGHGGDVVTWKVLIGTPGAYAGIPGDGKVGRIAQNEVGNAGADALPPQSLLSNRRLEEFWFALMR